MGNPLFSVFLPVLMVAVFSFLSIAVWTDARRKEREEYYKHETIKRVTESSEPGAAAALDLLRERERIELRRTREGVKLGGVVTSAVGLAIMIFLRAVVSGNDGRHVYLVGLIPLLVGAALLVYAYVLAPRD